MPNLYRNITAAVCTVILSLTMTPAMAQDQYSEQGAAQNQAVQVSDSQLELYAQAAQKVMGIKEELQTEMQDAKDAGEAQTMQTEAQEEMIGAVQSFGMTVDEYNTISRAVQTSPEMQDKLQQMIQ